MTTPIANINETISVTVGMWVDKVIDLVRTFMSIISKYDIMEASGELSSE